MSTPKRLFMLLFSTMILLAGPAFGQNQVIVGGPPAVTEQFVADEIIVKFKSGVSAPEIDAVNRRHGARERSSNHRGFRVLKIDAGKKVREMVARYKADPGVEYAEPNFIAYALAAPNDPYYPLQWNLQNGSGGIRAEAAWDVTTGNPGVVIGVLGTGVAYEDYTQTVGVYTRSYYQAPDLAQTRFVPGWDFVNNDAHPNDDNGHETHVTGTIAQSTGNGTGVAGIAAAASIMPVKVLNASGSGSYAAIASGIIWATDHGARLINMSLGGSSGSLTLEDACRYAYERGVTLVCAAGNNNAASVLYPAAYDNYCIAVGATRYDETRAGYSNYGAGLDVVAPGGDLGVDQNGDGYGDGVLQQTFGSPRYVKPNYYYDVWGYYFYQGTSMATPHVTGVAALLVAAGVATTPDQIREALQTTARDLGAPGYDAQYGWGLVDADAALQFGAAPNTPPVAVFSGPSSGLEDELLVFDASGSTDAEGDALTYSWSFGDGSTGTGASASHVYTAGGDYTVTLVVNDGRVDSAPSVAVVTITEVNDPPVAVAGPDLSANTGVAVALNGTGSYDPEGSVLSYAWNFGDGSAANTVAVSHVYAAAGTYTATLTVTDDGGLSATDSVVITVTDAPAEIQVFADSFEVGEWNGLWTEDRQNDWFRSSQRAVNGTRSAEVDGSASDAQLISIPIDLQGRTQATVTFSWLIESGLDTGEYIAFDVSTNGGGTWTEKARLRGNVDPENSWRAVTVELAGLTSLRLRFRGKMSGSDEDANVDMVKVVAR